MKYTSKVKFTFLDFKKEEINEDSETFEIEASSIEEAHYKSFNKVIENWDKGSIGITSIELI